MAAMQWSFRAQVPAVMAILLALGSRVPGAGAESRIPVDTGAGIPTSGTTFAGSQRVLVRWGGRLSLAYVKEVNGFDQLYVASSDDDGMTWTDSPQISAGPSKSSNPTLVAVPNGGLRVFWTKREILSPEEAARAEDQPTGVVGAGDIEPAARTGSSPDPGSAKKGDADEEDEHPRQIYTSLFDGQRWTPQTQVTRGGYNGFPSADFDSAGALHLVWYGYDGQYYQVVSSTLEGGAWSRPSLVSQGFPDSVNPTIVVDGRDDLHVAWYKYALASRDYQVFYRGFSRRDAQWTEQIQLSSSLRTAMNVSLAVGRDGAVYAAYEGEPVSGDGSGIFLRVLRDGIWSPQVRIAPAMRVLSQPSIAVDGDGTVLVFFQAADDDQVHLATSGDWTISTPITAVGTNRFPNAAWSRRGMLNGSQRRELVWTQVQADPRNQGGENLIRFLAVPVAAERRPG